MIITCRVGEYEKNIKKYWENTDESGANSFLLPLGTKFRLLHVHRRGPSPPSLLAVRTEFHAGGLEEFEHVHLHVAESSELKLCRHVKHRCCQCWGHFGAGPDQDPTFFFIDIKDAKQNIVFFHILFL
jgi:hypothetical protein